MKKRIGTFLLTFITVLVLLVGFGCQTANNPDTSTTQVPAQSSPVSDSTSGAASGSIGQRTKTSDCASNNALPDLECTPGAIIPDATVEQICQPGYSSSVRNVPDSEKNAVYAEYGIASHTTGQYEVDHLISLELGGSNDIANLWPEPADPRPGFHEKDKVENYMHSQVCAGNISLADAQYQIATNWLAIYDTLPK
jgi:hypothetical protein